MIFKILKKTSLIIVRKTEQLERLVHKHEQRL